jgi:periplasmic protein TonB
MDFDDEIEPQPQRFLKQYRVAIVVTALVLGGVITVAKLASSSGGSSRRDSITLVSLAPPPPPPPMMTPPPPPQEEQRMEQPMIKEEQPKEAPPKDEPPLGTGIKGDGPDSFGLSDKPGNGRIGGNNTNGSKWGWYASQVQSRIANAIRQNGKTRAAKLDIRVRIWPDSSGRVTRAQLATSTGNPSLDSVIRDEVLSSLQLQPPPTDMPTPIVLQLKAYRPH